MDELVWARHPSDGYILAKIVELTDDGAEVIPLNSKYQRSTLPFNDIFKANGDEKDYDDNCEMMYLNEGTLLNNVRVRYYKDKIYSYVANILIAVNPYKDIPSLYAPQTIKDYKGKSLGQKPPHVFAIADKAYRDMLVLKQSQSIIVSGESGAGKTESTKHLLKYLCDNWGAEVGTLEKKILDANPVLEAFGNAKTSRNNNSSRFGKFIEVHFDKKFKVAGGHISHYLLEKSRICSVEDEERNYHIFYMLLAGAPESLRSQLYLTQPDDFNYLKGGCTNYFTSPATAKGLDDSRKSAAYKKQGPLKDILLDDVAGFIELDQALARLELNESERNQIYATVAAVLHLGNVEFEDNPEDTRGGCRVIGSKEKYLLLASKLLEIDPSELKQALISRVMQSARGGMKGTVIMVPLKTYEATNARDALAKAIYSNMFDYIVNRINQSIPFQTSSYYIGVLDIAGFEFFTVNSFEQFCINYCNEKLQQFFNDMILKYEQELYKKEGLSVPEINYTDNQDCIDLIETKKGILNLLDEESKLPKPSYTHFTEEVHKTWPKEFRLGLPRSSNTLKGKLTFNSVSNKFKMQLTELMEKLRSNGTNFIRCIKPNSKMADHQFDGNLSLMQLKCSGMTTVLELMEYGYPSRAPFAELHQMYKAYLPKELMNLTAKQFCEAMLHSLNLYEKDFKFGITRVFFRPGKFAEFDKIMKSESDNLKSIVSQVKKWLVKSRWIKSQFCVLATIKMKNRIRARQDSLIVLQKMARGYLMRKRYRPRITALRSISKLETNLKQMEQVSQQLTKDKNAVINEINNLKNEFVAAIDKIKKDDKIDKIAVENLYKTLAKQVNLQMGALQKKIEEQKIAEEQERLKKIQEELEKQRKAKEEEERQLREEEENRRLKAEMEARRKQEEEERRKQEEADRLLAQKLAEQHAKDEEEHRRMQEQEEQERQDRELALRLAQESNGSIEESPPAIRKSEAHKNHQATMANGKHDLSKWKYSELRDTINTSCDIELLEACRHEFHRRLKVYHAWKAKNRKRTIMDENERAPRSVMESAVKSQRITPKPVLDNNSQRYFRIPFQRPGADQSRRGWWYAHFDGQYVARQMELHPDKVPILLVAGRDDMQMCELSLEETGLTRKRGAEILENEFNKEWEKNGVKKARYVGIQAQQFNTYVTLKLQNVKSTTVTVKGATPCWEQDFLFETNNLDTGLLIEVWSKGMIWDRAIGYHWIPLQTIQYSNEEGNGQWRSLEAELVMRDGEVIGTKMPTGHSLLLDCRFELPFDAENIEAMDLQRKLEMLNNSMDQEGRVDNFRRQMVYLGHSHDNHFENDISAGYSEDSDYTSDLNYPVGQHPNSSASQFRSAAYQINTPQRSLETSRENSSERADTPNAYNHQMLGAAHNHQQHLSPDVYRRNHQQHLSTTDNYGGYRSNARTQNSNQAQDNSNDAEPLFYNSRPHNRKLNRSNYSSHETAWMSCESTSHNQSIDSIDASYYADATEVPNSQYNKVRRPSLERQTTLYDEVIYDYPTFTSGSISRTIVPGRTTRIVSGTAGDVYSMYEECARPMSTGRRVMPQIPTKKASWRQFSQQSQDEGIKTPESCSHRGASLPPTPTKNSRIIARLAQSLEPARAMTPGRKLPTPNPNRGKRNKLLKWSNSADYADNQIDNSYTRYGAISAAENYNEDYNYAYQSTDNLPVVQDVDAYSIPNIANDKTVTYSQPNSITFQSDYYSKSAQNCDYNQTYYNDDPFRKQGNLDANQMMQQNTDSLESRDDDFKNSFDTAISSITNSMHQYTKSTYAEPIADTTLTDSINSSSKNHNLDNIAQKNILNMMPHLGDQHHNLRAIEKDDSNYRASAIDNSRLPNLTIAQIHNQSSFGDVSVSSNKGYLKSQNCIDSSYYGNQLDDKSVQEENYLDIQDSIDGYIEEETEDTISYGQNAIKHDSPMSVIHVNSRDSGAIDSILHTAEPSQASTMVDPYHPAAAAAMQRAQQQASGTNSRRSSAADPSYQTYDDPYLNYQRKNGSDAGIQDRRVSIRRSPSVAEPPEEIVKDELVHVGLQDEMPQETNLVIPQIQEEEPEQRPKITAQQRWLWAYNKIIMQLDVST
ncbi:unnamed protein product [Phyllotreta striolata]|uniref:Unconventional myosin-VI n=1 Tax=Phyllotreta striolata TaxID=444603 RepID=A0A9N9TEH9_PHYSR|nr:unnamed protein product [Phyllotreta striolata]